jgi:hypothetical protein
MVLKKKLLSLYLILSVSLKIAVSLKTSNTALESRCRSSRPPFCVGKFDLTLSLFYCELLYAASCVAMRLRRTADELTLSLFDCELLYAAICVAMRMRRTADEFLS